jgi:hypothetical protein
LISRAGPAATRGLGPAGAIGPAGVERVAQAAATPPGASKASSSRRGRRALDIGGQALVEEGAQRLDPAGRDGQARGHGVAAAGDQQAAVLGGEHAAPRSTPLIERPEPLPVPSSSSAMTIAGRPKRPSAAGDDADHAGMPAAPETMIRGASSPGPRPASPRLLGDQHFDRAAFLVEPVELGGDGPRFLGVGRGQQAHAEVGLADPAAGVDPRAEREAEVAAGRRLDQPRRLGERDEADIAAARP